MSTKISNAVSETLIDLFPSSAALTNSSTLLGGAQGSDTVAQPLALDFTLTCTWTSAPTAGSTVNLYLLRSVNGTTYAKGSTGTPGTIPQQALMVCQFVVDAVTTAQELHFYDIPGPPGLWEPLVENRTGQSMPAGWDLKVRPHSILST
jgi:hypothetical protein